MEGLEVCLNRIRENFDEAILNSSKPIAQAIGITDSLQEKRVKKTRRQSDEKSEDESRSLSALQTFRQECFLVLDRVMAEIKKRFHAMQIICTNFKMIIPKHLIAASLEDISLSVENLCLLYKDDFDLSDLKRELNSLKLWLPTILDTDPDDANPLELLNAIQKFEMQTAFVNVCIAIIIIIIIACLAGDVALASHDHA
jgi:hypothetical protein